MGRTRYYAYSQNTIILFEYVYLYVDFCLPPPLKKFHNRTDTNKHTLLSIMHVPTPKCVDLIQKLKKCDNFNAFNAWKGPLAKFSLMLVWKGTVKSRVEDRSTIQFCNVLFKDHNT